MSAVDERRAWDAYAAAAVSAAGAALAEKSLASEGAATITLYSDLAASYAALVADALLVERRERFGGGS